MLAEIILFFLTAAILWHITKKPSNYPPGPWGLPYIGYLWGLTNIEEQLHSLRKQYGNIVSWRIGSRLFIILFDYKTAKEAFQSIHFVDRPDVKLLTILGDENAQGIVASNGVHWHNIRRFSLRHLRDLGMGKSRLVSAIQHEATELVEVMKTKAGTPTKLPSEIIPAVLNVIWQMVANKRFAYDDQEIKQFHQMMSDLQQNTASLLIEDVFQWVKMFPEFMRSKITKSHLQKDLANKLRKLIKVHLDDHQKSLKDADSNNPRDYIEAYLIEMKNQENDPDSTMSTEDLVYCIADLFGAGSETTTITINWALYYLASFPKVQKKLQEEIDSALPGETLPSLEDKSKLHYTEAFIQEVLRYSSLAAGGGMHFSATDVEFGGYVIPKGSIVMAMASFMHFNPEFYESPQEFLPERFLDSNKKLSSPKEGFMPFGTGRRACLGEALARMELFIFLSTIIKHLSFEIPPGKSLDLSPTPNPFFHIPQTDQQILISLRSP